MCLFNIASTLTFILRWILQLLIVFVFSNRFIKLLFATYATCIVVHDVPNIGTNLGFLLRSRLFKYIIIN
jgi:hypothetical protein